jgi:hypothetical protein
MDGRKSDVLADVLADGLACSLADALMLASKTAMAHDATALCDERRKKPIFLPIFIVVGLQF